MRPHLLFADRDVDLDSPLPPQADDVANDLHVETLVTAMAAGDRYLAEVARRVLAVSLTDPGEIRYRQAVLSDCLAHPDTLRAFYQVTIDALEDRRRVWGWGIGSSGSPGLVLSGALRRLEAAMPRLRQLRTLAERHQESFASEGLVGLCAELRAELDDDYFALVEAHLSRLHFPDGVLVSAHLAADNSGTGYVLRESEDRSARWRRRLGLRAPGTLAFAIDPRDEGGGRALSELTDRGVNQVADAAARSADHVTGYFSALRAELAFYLGCVNLHDRLAPTGRPVCMPDPCPPGTGAWHAEELCDPALVLRSDSPVVGNALHADEQSLVVVTGANSGGKSTFLRSVGLAQLMAQCGMFVTAGSFRSDVASGVFTHFVREEDESMESGRLDDELARLSLIVDWLAPGALVAFNESFAGTNEQEGSEIARQVTRALAESGVRVVFVTHLFDFADSCQHLRPPALSLRAERAGDGRRSYQLSEAPPLPTSFAPELYRRIGGWACEDRATRGPRRDAAEPAR